MNYYPVLIPTLCRYEHFKRCVESLSRCTHADKTELVIGLDYPLNAGHEEGWKKICDYVPTIKGFRKVTCFRHDKNMGAGPNAGCLINYVREHYDAWIFSEDDNEFSPCFLDYMNKALDMYWDEPRVASVSGYLHLDFVGISTSGVVFTEDNNAWGLGVWKHKETNALDMTFFHSIWQSPLRFWLLYFRCPAIGSMFAAMMYKQTKWGDVMRTVRNIKLGIYQVRPYKSLVRNWGYDGSGLHCGDVNPEMSKQSILVQPLYEMPVDSAVKGSISACRLFFFQLCKNRIKACYQVFRMGLSVLKLRVKSRFT